MAVNVSVAHSNENGDIYITIRNGEEYIKLIYGKDDFFWCGTPNGSGYAYDNVAIYLENTLNDWIG